MKLLGDKRLLQVDGYTFAHNRKRYWYCSKKLQGCKAKVFMNAANTEITYYEGNHDHDPPVFVEGPDNYYIKIS